MKNFIRDIKQETIYGLRETSNQRMNEAFDDGYNKAANICVEIITKKIDELSNHYSSDSLSEGDHYLLLKLNELKSETEQELRNFWSDNEK